jgi:hypothetical protein
MSMTVEDQLADRLGAGAVLCAQTVGVRADRHTGPLPLTPAGEVRTSERGDVAPRQFYVLAEWDSIEVFQTFAANAALAEAHSDREDATSGTIRHLFDGVDLTDPAFRFDDDILPLLKP